MAESVEKLGPIETIRQIVEVFTRMKVDISIKEPGVDGFIDSQNNIHKSLFLLLFSMKDSDGRNIWYLNQQNAIFNFIEQFWPNAESGFDRVSSRSAPVLQKGDDARMRQIVESSTLPLSEAIDIVLAAYFRSVRTIARDNKIELPDLYHRLASAIARIEALWVCDSLAEESVEAAREKYSSSALSLQQDLGRLAVETETLTNRTALALDKSAQLEQTIASSSVSVETLAKTFNEKYENADEKATSFIESVRTKVNTGALKIHWVDRGRIARGQFWVSAAVIAAMLVAVPAVAIIYSDEVVAFMHHLTDAATVDVGPDPSAITVTVATISRLLIITIPVALYFWLIRLVVRFNMRSMLLMDDASIRATMLETYYRMIEDDAAKKEDRALVLQALVRPAPGHGADSVDPPNFTEVIDKAMGRS